MGKWNVNQIPTNIQGRFFVAREVDHHVQEGDQGSQTASGRQKTPTDMLGRIADIPQEDEDHEDICSKHRKETGKTSISSDAVNYITASQTVHPVREADSMQKAGGLCD